jgi:hypothetical protein
MSAFEQISFEMCTEMMITTEANEKVQKLDSTTKTCISNRTNSKIRPRPRNVTDSRVLEQC